MIIIIIVMTLFTLFVSPTMCLCLLCSIHRPCVFVYFVRFTDHVSLFTLFDSPTMCLYRSMQHLKQTARKNNPVARGVFPC